LKHTRPWSLLIVLLTVASGCIRSPSQDGTTDVHSPGSDSSSTAIAAPGPESVNTRTAPPDIDTDPLGIPIIADDDLDPLLRDALDEARAEVESQPDSADAWRSLANVFLSHRFLRAADVCLSRTLELTPDDPRALYLRSSIALETGQIERATAQLEAVLQLEPDYLPARFALGQSQLRLDRIDQAKVTFERLRSSPRPADVPWGELGLGLAEQRAGRPEAATRHLERAHAALPDLSQPSYALAMAYRDAGQPDKARQLLQQLDGQPTPARPDDPWLDQVLAERYDLQRLIRIGNRLLESGRIAEAEEQFRKVLRYDPESFDGHQNLGVILTRTERLEEARLELERAVEIEPENPDAHLSLGMTYAALGYPDLALRALDQTLRLRPDDPRALRVQQAIHETLRSLE
jgi:tetratricopeptide (TPR) repeat protein